MNNALWVADFVFQFLYKRVSNFILQVLPQSITEALRHRNYGKQIGTLPENVAYFR